MKVFYAFQIFCVLLAASSVTAASKEKQPKQREEQDDKVAKQSLQDSSDSILREFERLRNDVEQMINKDTNGHWVDPFNTLSALGLDDLSRVGMDIMPGGDQGELEQSGFEIPLKHSMALDVREDNEKYDMSVDVPGIPKEKIDIDLSDDVLTIRAHDEGSQVSKGEKDGVTWHRQERFGGKQERSMKLPPGVDKEKIKASQKDGVLHVILPKREEAKAKSRKINIE